MTENSVETAVRSASSWEVFKRSDSTGGQASGTRTGTFFALVDFGTSRALLRS